MKDYVPKPWQPPAVDHILEHKRCALWAPVGSGKTGIVLTALDIAHLAGEDVWPALAIGPLRVARKVWREEAGKWTHTQDISVSQIIGDADTRGYVVDRCCHPGNNALHQVYTINVENVAWLADRLAGRMPFRTIIFDESRKLKGFRLKQGGAMTGALGGNPATDDAWQFAWHKNVKRFIELTGTPASNGLKDLWGQMWFLDQGRRLGTSYAEFEQRWFGYKRIQDALSHKPSIQAVIQKGADEEIHDRVRDLCMSIDLKDYIDVKEPVYVPVPVTLPIAARKLYNEMERKLYIQIEKHEIEAFSAASKSIKLLQLANGAVYLDPDVEDDDAPNARAWREVHTAKLEALESIIEEMGDVPIIVAFQFKSDLARLQKAYPAGRLLDTERDEDDFKAGLVPYLWSHPKSAGHGIDGFQNVTNVIVFFGHWWDLELREQIIGRIGPTRQMQAGLDRPVYVYDIVAEDTIDEVVLERHKSKRQVEDLLLEAAKRKHYV